MTHDILQSDIELAVKLLKQGRPEAEIVGALIRRHVEPMKAAQLVDDLSKGKKVSPEVVTVIRKPSLRESPTPVRSSASLDRPRPIRPSHKPLSHPQHPSSKMPRYSWLGALVVICAIAGGGGWAYSHYRSQGRPTTPLPGQLAPGKPSDPPRPGFELLPDGLHLNGEHVTRANALETFTRFFGAPSRTNHVDQPSRAIYAFDSRGVLLYSQNAGTNDSVVLDFEALGGTDGAASPYSGQLRVDDQLVGADTDPQSLAALKMLGLTNLAGDGSIFAGNYRDLGLSFAYLKLPPRRLSVIVIDLK